MPWPPDPRERLLAAAQRVYGSVGFAGSTSADVAREAGLRLEDFEREFADGEACLLALYRDGLDRVASAVTAAVATTTHPGEQVLAGIGGLVGRFAAEPTLARVMLLEVIGAGPRVERARVAARARFAKLIELELGRVPGWAEAGEAERRIAAIATMAAVEEPLAQLVRAGELDEAPRIADHLAAYVLRALTPPR